MDSATFLCLFAVSFSWDASCAVSAVHNCLSTLSRLNVTCGVLLHKSQCYLCLIFIILYQLKSIHLSYAILAAVFVQINSKCIDGTSCVLVSVSNVCLLVEVNLVILICGAITRIMMSVFHCGSCFCDMLLHRSAVVYCTVT